MASFKKLSKSDVTVVPYHANKQWDLSYSLYPTSSEYLTIYNGTNLTGSFSPGHEPVTEDQYDRLVYTQINQLFYKVNFYQTHCFTNKHICKKTCDF